mgnify:CR=1 FL=1
MFSIGKVTITLKNKDTQKNLYRFLWKLLLSIALQLPFLYTWDSYLNPLLHTRYLNKGNIMMWGVYFILMVLFIHVFGGYKIGLSKKSNMMISQAIAMFCHNGVEIVITILMVGRVKHIGAIITSYGLLFIFQLLLIFLFSDLGINLYRAMFPPYRMLQIKGPYQNNLDKKMNQRGDKYVVEGELSYKESLPVIEKAIDEYDAVLLNDVPSAFRNKILKVCFDHSKKVYFTPKISDIMIKEAEELNLFDTPLFFTRNAGMNIWQKGIKRAIDIVISLIGIILTSPIMLVVAIAIHAYDKGPVFYKQTRCTIGGREFHVMKFRSMIVDAEKDGKARLATENDDRITPVGKFIRATRIDELPQFFNVLKGDMSMVGPRPERPEIIREYCETVPEFAYRTKVKAGLTGYAQVYGKYNTTSYDKLKLDLIYVSKCSILLDIQLILLTLKVIFLKESTEGLDEGETTAVNKKDKQ